MINIRYHIVSITAVFLALGIGVALGSTFLDRATVDVLNRNIGSAEKRIKATNAENERLTGQVDDAKERDASLVIVGSQELVADRLSDVPVLVVTAPGVDKKATDALRTMLDRSGADVRGTLELQAKMLFAGDPDRSLANDLDVRNPTPATLRSKVTTDLVAALSAAGLPAKDKGKGGGSGGSATTTTTTTTTTPSGDGTIEAPDGEQPAIVTTLLDHGYLRLDAGSVHADDDPILETAGYRFVFVGAPNLETAQTDALLRLLPAADGVATVPAVVVSATAPAPVDGSVVVPSAVAQVRTTDALAQRYSTVDDVDTFAGLVATILTLEHIDEVAPGHYGQADGATAVLPPAT